MNSKWAYGFDGDHEYHNCRDRLSCSQIFDVEKIFLAYG